MNEGAPVMEIRGLAKRFGPVKAVDGITFSLFAGEVHGFIGPNGAGKTTTMRILAGVERPDAGEVLLEGASLLERSDLCRPRIGFMPDYLDPYPHILVGEYLDFYSRLHGFRPALRRERVRDVAAFTGLAERLSQSAESLSKGWKQRLSLARVLLGDPKVLILDEPAAGLDPRARVELRDMVRLLAANGRAVFVSSHILSELAEMCTAVTIIENGRLRISGGLDALHRTVGKGVRTAVALLDPDAAGTARLVRFLAAIPEVESVREQPGGAVFVHAGEAPFKAELLRRLLAEGFAVTEFHSAGSSLEEAFIHLTGGDEA